MEFVQNITPPDFRLKILHRQFHLISTFLVRKNDKNEWKWRNWHRWQKFYTAPGTDGMDKFHLWRRGNIISVSDHWRRKTREIEPSRIDRQEMTFMIFSSPYFWRTPHTGRHRGVRSLTRWQSYARSSLPVSQKLMIVMLTAMCDHNDHTGSLNISNPPRFLKRIFSIATCPNLLIADRNALSQSNQ